MFNESSAGLLFPVILQIPDRKLLLMFFGQRIYKTARNNRKGEHSWMIIQGILTTRSSIKC
jgi:hypothetical protein